MRRIRIIVSAAHSFIHSFRESHMQNDRFFGLFVVVGSISLILIGFLPIILNYAR